MEEDGKFPNWFLWIWDHFPTVLIAVALIGAIVFGSVYFMESRLSDIENQLNYAPPRSYVPPDLQDYDAAGTAPAQLTDRHMVYVPVYSHIYYQAGSAYPLETTLSIRNVDTAKPIYVESVEYYDTNGKLAKKQLDRLIKLSPLQTIEYLIERRDSSGGSGANFLVRWGSMSSVNEPLIETVMVGTAGTQGIGFGRTGIEISVSETANK